MPSSLPRVRVVATGGSIAGIGRDRLDYTIYPELGNKLTIDQQLDRIPEVKEIAEVQTESLHNVGSTSIGHKEWLGIGQRINQIFQEDPGAAGVVVTHGTATLEETAYFLHLTVKSPKPVVVTGAMRPPSSISTDADINLLDAIRIAATPDAGGKGVLTVLNNEIQSARDVSKSNTLRVETFKPNELGFLGYADSDGEVVFYRIPTRKHTTSTPFDIAGVKSLPRVDIVYTYAGDDGMLVEAVSQHRSDGLILAGFGSGTLPPVVMEAGAQAVKAGISVVLASRAAAGRVVMTPRTDSLGFMVSDSLLPQKARILLMLALNVTRDRKEVQRMFYEY